MPLGSSTPAPQNPRGLWYLKLRPTIETSLASKADAIVSPWKACTVVSSKRNDRGCCLSIASPREERQEVIGCLPRPENTIEGSDGSRCPGRAGKSLRKSCASRFPRSGLVCCCGDKGSPTSCDLRPQLPLRGGHC